MRVFFLGIILLLSFYLLTQDVYAKILPQAKGGKITAVKKSSGIGVSVSPRLRNDRKALLVSFANLGNARSLSYTLIYTTNGQEEGAGGTVLTSQGSATRELLFGTCSKNVCRYHTNISKMRLEVTYTSTTGKKYLKRYRIKV